VGKNKELRINDAAELRAEEQGKARVVSGYAAKYSRLSNDVGGFKEKIAPGAFRMAVSQRQDVRCLVNHDASLILGRTTSGTLKLEEDSVGLRFRCELPDTQYARDYYVAVRRGDISQCSFSFSVTKEDQSWDENGVDDDGKKCVIRTLRNISELSDVSVVTYPAYEDTDAMARKRSSEFHTPTPPEDRYARLTRVFREING